MEMHETIEKLIVASDTAFADVRWPAAHNLPRYEVGTLEEMEAAYVIKNFGGKRREEFERVIDGSNIEELISMSEHGISYYLPCFLKKLLRDRDDFSFTIGMISLLSNRAVKPGVNIWPQFTKEQSLAIFDTVSLVLQHIKSYQMGEFEAEYRQKLQEAHKFWS